MSDPLEELTGVTPPVEDRSISFRERLQSRRNAILEDKTVDLEVPGYDGDLAVRYRPLDPDERKAIGRRVKQRGDDEEGISFACAVLVAACETILVREEVGGPLEELTTDNGQPVKFDPNLAEFLGFEGEKAEEVILGVFSPDRDRDSRVLLHLQALSDWVAGRNSEILEDLLGK